MAANVISILWMQTVASVPISSYITSHTNNDSYFSSQEWCLKIIQNIRLNQNLSKCILKQLSDGASTINVSSEFHKFWQWVLQIHISFREKIFPNIILIILNCIFLHLKYISSTMGNFTHILGATSTSYNLLIILYVSIISSLHGPYFSAGNFKYATVKNIVSLLTEANVNAKYPNRVLVTLHHNLHFLF